MYSSANGTESKDALKKALIDAIIEKSKTKEPELHYDGKRLEFYLKSESSDPSAYKINSETVLKPIITDVIIDVMTTIVGRQDTKLCFPLEHPDKKCAPIKESISESSGGRIQKKKKISTRRRNRK